MAGMYPFPANRLIQVSSLPTVNGDPSIGHPESQLNRPSYQVILEKLFGSTKIAGMRYISLPPVRTSDRTEFHPSATEG